MHNTEIQNIKQRFGIIGNSPKLNHAIEVAAQVAPTDMTVLISGESGSGKESFSKIIHSLSPHKHGQFIAVNCGAIPEGTIDSELFGHEKGSFTGAHEARKGYFEVTDGGTIFLDEISELPHGTQARLLRVLEYGEFIRVGSSKVMKANVRVIAATNKDLLERVERGKFREDLYYRLNTVPIYVPPLRERGDDILLLFKKFAADFSENYRTKPIELSQEAQATLLEYHFPGNIRQLKNLVEQISVLEMDRLVTDDALLKYLPRTRNMPAIINHKGHSGEKLSERDILYKVLFDMKQDMTELKKLVLDIIQHDKSTELIQEHEGLFKDVNTDDPKPRDPAPYLLPVDEPDKETFSLETQKKKTNEEDELEIQDITHETEDDDLSLEKKEKELIIKALHKNNNKRKYAAKDLGISERTLYRKIKQYEIDN